MSKEFIEKMEAFLKTRDVDVVVLTTKEQVKNADSFVAACKPMHKREF